MTYQDYSRFLQQFQLVQEDPCFLCGNRRITAVGIYMPPRDVEQHVFHVPDNKMALCIHGLCNACSLHPDTPARVERKYIQLQAEQN